MRSRRSYTTLIAVPFAVLGLVGCVDSAEPDTTDTIAPLPTVTTLVAPTTSLLTTTPTVLIGGTGATSPTTIPTTATAADGGTEGTAATEDTEPVDTTPVVGKATYKVVANDTLFGIARKCSITAAALAEYNKWSDGVEHSIFPGDSVALPCEPATSTSTTVAGATTTTASGSSGSATTTTTFDPSTGGTYTVVEGDYLSIIATKTGTTVAAIVAANGWENDQHVIIVGQKIKLPAKAG